MFSTQSINDEVIVFNNGMKYCRIVAGSGTNRKWLINFADTFCRIVNYVEDRTRIENERSTKQIMNQAIDAVVKKTAKKKQTAKKKTAKSISISNVGKKTAKKKAAKKKVRK